MNWLNTPAVIICILACIVTLFISPIKVQCEEQSFSLLNMNESLSGMVVSGEINYYKITVPEGSAFLCVQLTGVTGDPDIFLQTQPTSDATVLSSSTFDPDLNELILYNKPQAGEFYIAVLGYSDATYTITVKMIQHQDILPITENSIGQLTLAKGDFVIYKLTLESPYVLLHIGVIPESGDPDLMIFYNEGVQINTSMEYDLTPDWIFETEPQQGEWYIAVSGYLDSVYHLTAKLLSLDHSTSLAVNENSQQSIASGEYKIYKYHVPEDSDNFNIEFNVISGKAVILGIRQDAS